MPIRGDVATLFDTLRNRTKATLILVLEPTGDIADVVVADGLGLTNTPWPMADSLQRSLAGQPVIFGALDAIVAFQDHPAIKEGVLASAICCAVGRSDERRLFLWGHAERHRFGSPDRHILERLIPIIHTILKDVPKTKLMASYDPSDEQTRVIENRPNSSIGDTLITSPSLRLISSDWRTENGRY